MTALIVILSVFGVLGLLLCVPLGVLVKYDEDITVAVRILGLRITLYPTKEKPSKKPKQKKQKKQTSKQKEKSGSAFSDKLMPWKTSDAPVQTFMVCAKTALEALCKLLKSIHIATLHVRCTVGGDDPDAALNYGYAWAIIGCVVPYLDGALHVKHIDASAEYDCTAADLKLYIFAEVRLMLIQILAILIRYADKYLKIEKGGKSHE